MNNNSTRQSVSILRLSAKSVDILVALVLLVAAVLKFWSLLFQGQASIDSPFSSRVQYGAAQFEILLGLWLISGIDKWAARIIAAVTFAVFAAVNVQLLVVGRRSCGCFGEMTVSPFAVLFLDVVLVGLLITSLVANRKVVERAELKRALKLGFSFAVVVGVISIIYVSLNDPMQSLAQLRGDHVVANPAIIDFGYGEPGEQRRVICTLINYSDIPVTILGGPTGCAVVAVEGLPVIVPPGQTTNLSMIVTCPVAPGLFRKSIFMYTDDPARPSVTAEVHGAVR